MIIEMKIQKCFEDCVKGEISKEKQIYDGLILKLVSSVSFVC
ncbi:MAG: hypothetical protein ACI35S_02770 [Anaeroplasma sp.]